MTEYLQGTNNAFKPVLANLDNQHHRTGVLITCLANLAGSGVRHALAVLASLATADVNTRPGPIGAGSAQDVDTLGIVFDRASDAVQGDLRDRDTIRGGASWAAVLVVLLDLDAVLGDAGQGDVAVGDAGDLARLAGDGLDADAVGGVFDGGGLDVDVGDGVVVAAADGADGEAVAAGAGAASEGQTVDGVDSQAVL